MKYTDKEIIKINTEGLERFSQIADKVNKRPKENESTLCKWTTDKTEIKEGDILCCGDNYPCVVFYNPFEARFDAIEFGYKNEKLSFSIYRTHELRSYTSPWKIIGNINDKDFKIKGMSKNFNYTKSLAKYYK